MTGIDERLGGRLPLVDPEQLTGEQRALYEHLEKHLFPAAQRAGFQTKTGGGRVIGPFNAVVLDAGVAAGLVAFMEAEVGSTSLDDRTRQTIILMAIPRRSASSVIEEWSTSSCWSATTKRSAAY